MGGIQEQELYPPIQRFFQEQGFTVFSEVKGCDVVATQGKRTIIVEMKTSFQLKLLYQAIDRQGLSEEVYVAIPRPKSSNTNQYKSMVKLLKRLDLGLLTVALDSPLETVDVVILPGEAKARKNGRKRKALADEIAGRTIDQNTGGMCRKKIVTAYREKSIELCCMMEVMGAVSVAKFRELGLDEKQIRILGSNVYGWYSRQKKGVYGLSPMGVEMLENKEYPALITFYREKWAGSFSS